MTEHVTARNIADPLQKLAWNLGFYGLCRRWAEVKDLPEIKHIVELEEKERAERSLENRIRLSKISRFRPMADFDWQWPTEIDRLAIDDLLTLKFVKEGLNPILIGPNGVGKTMIAKNLAHRALLAGHTVRFTTAAAMLGQLAETDSASLRHRLMSALHKLDFLAIDEVGQLSYDTRFADLFYEVISCRYEQQRPTLISTNKEFTQWDEIFPSKSTTVTIVERLIHRSEIIQIKGPSYRKFEAEERARARAAARAER